jgi:hypothetical protein
VLAPFARKNFMDLGRLRKEPLGRLIRRKLLYTLFRQSWNVGITPHAVAIVAGLEGTRRQRQALDEVRWMDERREAFAADPFIIRDGPTEGGYLLFYECFPWRSGLGRIDCVAIRDGHFGTSRVILESPFHLSYPFILELGEDRVMIPEQAGSRQLAAYRLGAGGTVTGSETLAAGVSLLDSTIIQRDGRFWLFATHAGPDDNVELHLYHSDAVSGPWQAHARNPIKRERTNARPAGPFFAHAGELFRPAQDCGSHYGAGIVVNRLATLNEEAFAEEPVSEIRPPPGSRYDFGLHTISSAGGCTAIDGARIESVIHPHLDRLGRYVHPGAAAR